MKFISMFSSTLSFRSLVCNKIREKVESAGSHFVILLFFYHDESWKKLRNYVCYHTWSIAKCEQRLSKWGKMENFSSFIFYHEQRAMTTTATEKCKNWKILLRLIWMPECQIYAWENLQTYHITPLHHLSLKGAFEWSGKKNILLYVA